MVTEAIEARLSVQGVKGGRADSPWVCSDGGGRGSASPKGQGRPQAMVGAANSCLRQASVAQPRGRGGSLPARQSMD